MYSRQQFRLPSVSSSVLVVAMALSKCLSSNQDIITWLLHSLIVKRLSTPSTSHLEIILHYCERHQQYCFVLMQRNCINIRTWKMRSLILYSFPSHIQAYPIISMDIEVLTQRVLRATNSLYKSSWAQHNIYWQQMVKLIAHSRHHLHMKIGPFPILPSMRLNLNLNKTSTHSFFLAILINRPKVSDLWAMGKPRHSSLVKSINIKLMVRKRRVLSTLHHHSLSLLNSLQLVMAILKQLDMIGWWWYWCCCAWYYYHGCVLLWVSR